MQITGHPISAKLPSDPHFQDRFWYWAGSSGRDYIHSVYGLDNLPPLPGAIYVAVRNEDGVRQAVAVGRFAPFWDATLGAGDVLRLQDEGVNEIHVHLLSQSPDEAAVRFQDLQAAFDERQAHAGCLLAAHGLRPVSLLATA